jgi:hypothetical protein
LPKVPPYPYNAALYTNSERFYDAESNSYWYRMLFYDGYQYFLVLDEKIEERK